jgi:bifunctional DNA-binding transcriptional regulator/antitoxin component of YhaV-PrlF toxin-antitoxin module
MHAIVRVSAKGRLVIPVELRRKHKVEPGTKAEFSESAFAGIVLTIRNRARTRQAVGEKRNTKK